MSTLRAVLPRHSHLGSSGHGTRGLLLLFTLVAYEDQGSQGPTLSLGYMGDTGELGASQASAVGSKWPGLLPGRAGGHPKPCFLRQFV